MKRGAILIACVAITGCGGSSTLSKQELVNKANAICKSTRDAAVKIQPPTSSDAKSQAAYWDKAAPLLDKAVTQLSALNPDSSAKANWTVFVNTLKQVNDLYKKATAKFDAGDASGQKYIDQTRGLALQANAAATKVGASTCAS